MIEPANDVSDRDRPDEIIFAFRRNVVVAASAGTGKTHRLTALYLLLALGLTSMGQDDDRTATAVVPPDRIVATTFSRAAAREIGERVERSLRAIAAWNEAEPLPFGDVLRVRTERVGRELSAAELRTRAKEALARWGSSRIDTLHGVAAQVALGNALVLGLPPGAHVLDEDEAQALADAAVDDTLGAALSAGAEHAEAARSLIAACSGVALTRIAVTKLLDRLDEEGIRPRDLALSDHLGAARAVGRELLRVVGGAAAGGTDPFRSHAAGLASALTGYAREIDQGAAFPDAAVAKAIELFTARAPSKKKRTSADDELASYRDNLSGKNNRERICHVVALLREAPALAARERGVVDLLEDIRSRLQAGRRRAGALSFGDLLRGARDGLRDVPEVSAGARAAIDVLLVDEFQDSSRVQRDLVYLLRERDDAARSRPAGVDPRADGLVGHGLFLVGDRKQSIYGFRGADVAVFARICVELAGKSAAGALGIAMPAGAAEADHAVADFVALRESRRSGASVLGFVNTFAARDFAAGRDAEPRDYEVAYGAAEHLVPAPPDPGKDARSPGNVVFVRDDGSLRDGAPPIVRDAAGAGREGFLAAAVVARALRDGTAACREIAVLARRRSTLPLVELGLSRLGIPYVVAGRALYDAREIRDVAAVLRLLLDPRDRLALATVLRGPVVALSDAALARLAAPDAGIRVSLVRADVRGPGAADDEEARIAELEPDDRGRLEAFRAKFDGLRRAAMRIPPAEAIRAAIEAFDLDQILAALPRAEARLGNVDRLAGIARRRGGNLASFVRWLEQRIADEADEAEAAVFSQEDDAVRLTTIHASKGLDFPVVILVDLNAQPHAGSAGVTFTPSSAGRDPTLAFRHFGRHPERGGDDPERPWAIAEPFAITTTALRDARADARLREQAERCRLTYVAVTRARRELVLIGSSGTVRRGSALATMTQGLDDPAFATAITRFEDAAELLDSAERGKGDPRGAVAACDVRAPARPVRSTTQIVAIATTPLSLFRGCPRRFRFRHLLGIDEPLSTGQLDLFAAGAEPDAGTPEPIEDATDPRALGRAAHRLLERWPAERWGAAAPLDEIVARLVAEGLPPDGEAARIAAGVARFLEGRYASALQEEGAELAREEEFVLSVAAKADAPRILALRGAIDLLASRPGGSVDVIDYKLSAARSDLGPYEFQLRTYALAARHRFPERPVRAGVLFLGSREEPSFLPGKAGGGALSEAEHAAFERELGELGERLAEARYSGQFDGVAPDRCRKLHCGFLGVCHPDVRGRRH